MNGDLLALAGGGGGAKLAHGFSLILESKRLIIVGNTGDDEVFYGLNISPDLDSIMYTLAGMINNHMGYGIESDTFAVLQSLNKFGLETWFSIGDKDFGTHLKRTTLLNQGYSLSEVTKELLTRLDINHSVVPMTDQLVKTILNTNTEALSFQEYFVHRHSEDVITSIIYEGSKNAKPSSEFLLALQSAKAIVISPSNPYLSIGPILSINGVRDSIEMFKGPVAIVSPIISGKALKGPAGKLIREIMSEDPTPYSIAKYYKGLGSHFIMDIQDAKFELDIKDLGYEVLLTNTIMDDPKSKALLAKNICRFIGISI
jgi:LPPG:FO 2-phospho-L-lactate transferase